MCWLPPWGPASPAVVVGVALREERARPLEHVLGFEDPDGRLELVGEPGVKVDITRRVDQALRLADRERTTVCDLRGNLVRAVARLAVGDDLVDKPDPGGLLRPDHPAGQDQLLGPGRTHDPWQALRPARTRRHRQPDLG